MKKRNRAGEKRAAVRLLHTMRSAGAAALLSILCCLGAGTAAFAEDALQIGIDQYDVTEDGSILVYVNQNGDEGFAPDGEESSLLIGKNPLSIANLESFSERNEPVTYLCLVDISGSMTEEGIGHAKEVLQQLVDAKGPEDNICITTMGNDVQSSGFLSDAKALSEAVKGIARVSTEDTNLYYSVKEAVNVLKTDRAVNRKRCLLIFSDGEDDQKKGITQKEAEDAVKDGHIPVFTVVLAGKNLKDGEGSAKILGSFARNSAGGEHYAPTYDDRYGYEDIYPSVRRRLDTSLVVTASLSGLKEVGDDTVYIGVELSDGTRSASDGITVPAGKIIEAVEALEQAEAEEKQDDGAEQQTPEEQEEPEPAKPSRISRKTLIGILLLAIVAVIAVIALLCRKRAAEREEEEEDYEETDYDNGGYASADGGASGYGTDVVQIGFYDEPVTMPGESETGRQEISRMETGRAEQTVPRKERKKRTGKDRAELTLFQIGPGEAQAYRLTVREKATIGRNKTCQLTLEDDTALSGVHCSVIYRDGRLYVRDEESTNGTFINGVPIVGEYQAQQDDILLIGSSEYRMVWE